jgi:putative phage-type endonuclease
MDRSKGIGGSDAAAVLGLSKYKSPLELYLEKIGELDSDIPDNDAMYWGRTLEEIVAQEYAKRTGNKVRRVNRVLQHNEHSWMLANIDREIISDRGRGVLECKTANAWLTSEWDDGQVPDAYLLQLMHYLAVTGRQWGSIAVLIGGQKFIIQDFERDDELIEMMIEKERAFWEDHVLKRITPEYGVVSSALMSKLYPQSTGRSIEIADDAIGDAIRDYIDARELEKEQKDRKDTAKAVIQGAMQDAAKGAYVNPATGEPEKRGTNLTAGEHDR